MTSLHRFRRFIFLLLSLTLSAQAMAVASMGACHRMNSLTKSHRIAASAHDHAAAAGHHLHAHGGETAVPDSNGVQAADSGGTSTSGDNGRGSCAACAACHVASAILNSELDLIDIPRCGSVMFPALEVARLRPVASGLERPPRA